MLLHKLLANLILMLLLHSIILRRNDHLGIVDLFFAPSPLRQVCEGAPRLCDLASFHLLGAGKGLRVALVLKSRLRNLFLVDIDVGLRARVL